MPMHYATCLRRLLVALLVIMALSAPGALVTPALAQSDQAGSAAGEQADASPAAPLAPESLEAALDTLKSDAERQELIQQLETILAAKRAEAEAAKEPKPSPDSFGARLLSFVSERLEGAARDLGEAANQLVALPEIAARAWEQAQSAEAREVWLEVLGKVILALGAGLLVEVVLTRALRAPRERMNAKVGEGMVARLFYLAGRTVIDVIPIGAFAAVSYGLLPMLEPRETTRLVALALINANIFTRVATAVGRFVVVPGASGLRLVPMGDETANYLYIWLRRVSAVAIYGYFLAEATFLLGLAAGTYGVLLKLLGLVVFVMVVVFVLQNRQAVAQFLSGDPDDPIRGLRGRLAEIWHILIIAYLVAFYAVWAMEIRDGFIFLAKATGLTIAVVFVAKALSIGARRVVARGFHLNAELQERYPLLEERANRYLPAVQASAQFVIWVLAILALMQVWGLNVFAWLGSEAGQSLGGRIATILLIVVLALAFWEVLSAVIEKMLRARSETEGRSSARLVTLLPLIRNAVRIVLGVLVVLIILSEIGIDIGPLLAGAGVVGLAIGFGAQTLVKDVITGVFILVEDSISVGDWVELGGQSGGVESMTIRTVRLRDLHGVVHTIPFGDISAVTNMSREFGYSLIDIGVAYRENVDEVFKVMQEVGAELVEDEKWSADLLGELEVFGVNNLADSAVELRVRLKTKPLRQWAVRREFLRRIKDRFDREGIEIPFPHRTLYFGIDKEGTAPPARVVAETAEQADRDQKRSAEKSTDSENSVEPEEAPETERGKKGSEGELG